MVAPFPGIVYKGDNPDEVIIEANTAALKDIKIYVNNVNVNTTILHPSDELYIEYRVRFIRKASDKPIDFGVN